MSRHKLIRYTFYAITAAALPLTAYLTDLVYFQTNDDFTQMLITSGILYGTPSSQLLYLAKPLSIFLAFMYSLSQNYSWYTIALLATQGLAIFGYLVLIDDLWKIKNTRKKLFSGLLLYSPILIYAILFFALQYTQTAMMAAGAGALLLIFSKDIYQKLFAISLIVLGIFWRADAGLIAILLIISFYGLNLLISRKFSKSEFRFRELTILLVTVCFSYSIFLAGSHEKSPFISNDKQVALSYYKSLGKVLDYQPTTQSKKLLHERARKVGWTNNDFRLLNNKFYFANKEVYTEDRNLKLADITTPNSQVKFTFNVTQNLNKILWNNHKRSITFLILFFALSFLIFQRNKFFHLFSYLIIFYLFLILILSMGRIPERIVWPLAFIALISLGVIFLNNQQPEEDNNNYISKYTNYLLPLFLGIFYILISLNLYDQYLKIDKELWWKSAKKDKIYGFDRVLNYNPDKPIVAFSSFYSALLKTHSPTKPPSQTEEIWKNMILIGWTIRSPEMDKKLKSLNLSEDLFTSIAEQRAYLATSDHLVEIDYLNRYFKQHRYIKVKWAIAPFVFNDTGLGIWQIDSYEATELTE